MQLRGRESERARGEVKLKEKRATVHAIGRMRDVENETRDMSARETN